MWLFLFEAPSAETTTYADSCKWQMEVLCNRKVKGHADTAFVMCLHAANCQIILNPKFATITCAPLIKKKL